MTLGAALLFAAYATFVLFLVSGMIRAKAWKPALLLALGNLLLLLVALSYWYKPACRGLQNSFATILALEFAAPFVLAALLAPLAVVAQLRAQLTANKLIRAISMAGALTITLSAAPLVYAYKVMVLNECQMNRPPNQALQWTPSRCAVGFPRSLRSLGATERRRWA